MTPRRCVRCRLRKRHRTHLRRANWWLAGLDNFYGFFWGITSYFHLRHSPSSLYTTRVAREECIAFIFRLTVLYVSSRVSGRRSKRYGSTATLFSWRDPSPHALQESLLHREKDWRRRLRFGLQGQGHPERRSPRCSQRSESAGTASTGND